MSHQGLGAERRRPLYGLDAGDEGQGTGKPPPPSGGAECKSTRLAEKGPALTPTPPRPPSIVPLSYPLALSSSIKVLQRRYLRMRGLQGPK